MKRKGNLNQEDALFGLNAVDAVHPVIFQRRWNYPAFPLQCSRHHLNHKRVGRISPRSIQTLNGYPENLRSETGRRTSLRALGTTRLLRSRDQSRRKRTGVLDSDSASE